MLAISREKELSINDAIRAKEVRVVGPEGEQFGIMTPKEGIRAAFEKGLDLVEIAPQAVPPVCKMMDYGKFRFEKAKKDKEAKKKQQTSELKEVQLSCRIEDHDFNTKLGHALRFLESGNKVKVTVRYRGREMAHINIGEEMLQKFADACSEKAVLDKPAKLEGRIMAITLSPKQK